MLGWITGPDGQVANSADVPKLPEPPETPAPVFAIRAFKSALFGTPGADDDEDAEQTLRPKNRPAENLRGNNDLLKPPASNPGDAGAVKKPDVDLAVQAMTSPTKSILVTPGTTSNRRKTVSFGDGVVDNERKRNGPPSAKTTKTPTNQSGNLSNQWMSASSDGKNKPRSKLTQTLMDARDKPSKNAQPSHPVKVDQGSAAAAEAEEAPQLEDAHDETINLDEPCSQSGKYWKAEFESYRMKTTGEIKKLIQYRSVAKSFARKKDEEAARLADKLRQEEGKVAEMERHVTRLASTMVGEGAKADKEKLIQELTKQTALALQYKHRVGQLRKLLERHGVVGGEIDEVAGQAVNEVPSDNTVEELRRTQQALEQANAKIEEMKRQQSDLGRLQDLLQSSEKKASDLEKENTTLKQTLARVKQEMTKYEGRRKEKEAKLKQREAKLETRVQEYRERIKQHRQSEEALKESFNEERTRMQEQIDLLKLKITTMEHFTSTGTNRQYTYSPRKGYTGVQVYDFGVPGHQEPTSNEMDDLDEPPSPSPRSKERARRSRVSTSAVPDLRRPNKTAAVEENVDAITYYEDSPRKAYQYRSRHAGTGHIDSVPPSSPPDLPPIETSSRPLPERPKYEPDTRRTYLALHSNMVSLPPPLENLEHPQTRRSQPRRSPAKYSLDALSGIPSSRNGTSAAHHVSTGRSGKRSSLAGPHIDAMTAERVAAAQARLRRKEESRKGKEDGKENIRAYVN